MPAFKYTIEHEKVRNFKSVYWNWICHLSLTTMTKNKFYTLVGLVFYSNQYVKAYEVIDFQFNNSSKKDLFLTKQVTD